MVGRITLFQLRHSKSPNSEDSDLCYYCPVGQNSPPGPLQRAAAGWAQTPDCMRGGGGYWGGGQQVTGLHPRNRYSRQHRTHFLHIHKPWLQTRRQQLTFMDCINNICYLPYMLRWIFSFSVSPHWRLDLWWVVQVCVWRLVSRHHGGGELQHSSCFRVLTITCEVA